MTTQEVKRKLAAILSADVKGYSRLMGEDEEGTIRTLNAVWGGREWRSAMASLNGHDTGNGGYSQGDT